MSGAINDVLRVAASFGLPGATSLATPLSAEAIALANVHRVQGLLWAAIDAGAVTGGDDLIATARESLLAGLRTCLLAEETAALALAALDAEGIRTMVLKGLAIAHLDHRDPAERVFGDADILVRRADHDRALVALAAAGFRRSNPPIRRWWERRFAKAVVLISPAGGELDLHLAIAGGYFGAGVSESELWAGAESFELAGRQVHSLDCETRLLPQCVGRTLRSACAARRRTDLACCWRRLGSHRALGPTSWP